jgi:tetrapyrrole methylase family protein/MazG family protein
MAQLTIVGLGPGDPDWLTRAAWETLLLADEVYLRTRVHPTVAHLPAGPTYHDFDDLYEHAENFAAVYDAIVTRLLARLKDGRDVVYAVPGDPLVGEGTVTRLLAACQEGGPAIRVVHGVSFIEPVLAALGTDALDGLQILDATDVALATHPPINPDCPALIAQLYSRDLASDVKLTLMNQYPDEFPVHLVHAAGTKVQQVEAITLYALDRSDRIAHLTTLHIPALRPGAVVSFEGFQDTVARLRAPDGCPWDRQQTHQTLRTHLMEEAYEVLAVLDADDPDLLCEELGDLLLQIVLHSQIAVDEGEFRMADVIGRIDAKIKHRHPHVWGDMDVGGDSNQVLVNWEKIKAEERAGGGKGLLDGVPKALPALAQSHAYDSRAARVGFDWPDEEGVIAKVREEFEEVRAASTPEERFWEIGDLLFVVAVWARWMGIDPEDALREANGRFYRRFAHIEKSAREQGRALTSLSFEELDALWNDAKNVT